MTVVLSLVAAVVCFKQFARNPTRCLGLVPISWSLETKLMGKSYRATVVIITRNRKQDLHGAIDSALNQSVPVEVLVVDDASSDGTSQMIRDQFPQVQLRQVEQACGYIAHRNWAAQLAAAPIIFSIDDDAVFASPKTVEQTLGQFDHPRVGAVAIPYVNVNHAPTVLQRAPDGQQLYVSFTYRGTAHALRRDLFLRLGGYRVQLVHQTEEGDYTTRMVNAGYITRIGGADPIHHFESPQRDLTRQRTHLARNHVLYVWHNVPMPFFVAHLMGTTGNILRHGARSRSLGTAVRGLIAGYGALFTRQCERQPITWRSYRLCRYLIKRGPVPLGQIEPRLPEMKWQTVDRPFSDE